MHYGLQLGQVSNSQEQGWPGIRQWFDVSFLAGLPPGELALRLRNLLA